MQKLKFAGALIIALGLSAGSAVAAGCSEADFEAKQKELMEHIKANPGKASKIEGLAKEVEKEYGGEPPVDKRCEAMDKLTAKVKAAK